MSKSREPHLHLIRIVALNTGTVNCKLHNVTQWDEIHATMLDLHCPIYYYCLEEEAKVYCGLLLLPLFIIIRFFLLFRRGRVVGG